MSLISCGGCYHRFTARPDDISEEEDQTGFPGYYRNSKREYVRCPSCGAQLVLNETNVRYNVVWKRAPQSQKSGFLVLIKDKHLRGICYYSDQLKKVNSVYNPSSATTLDEVLQVGYVMITESGTSLTAIIMELRNGNQNIKVELE